MAFKEEVLVGIDFLFGLRKGDKLYENVMRALTMNERGEIKINILSTAVLEASQLSNCFYRGLGK